MQNICFVHNVSVVGGAERMSQAIMKGLPSESFKSHLVCTDHGELIEECEALDVTCHTHNMQQPDFKKPIKSLAAYFRWKKIIKDNDVDVFHTGDLISTRSLSYAAKASNTPVICHIHFPFKKAFADWVFKGRPHPKGFIFCSQELRNDVGPMLAEVCPNAEQWVIHNGVNVEKFVPAEKNNTKPKIGIIANLQLRKGHDEFLNMAKIIRDKGFDTHFDIIGGDILEEPREEKLKKLSEELGIAEHVKFHGQVSNVLTLLQQLDVLVCASHEEAFPVSILEAMSCGLPVVSTNVNGIPEGIVEGETGFMVPPFKAEQLAEGVIKLLNDENLLSSMGNMGRDRVVKNFSEERYVEKIINTYREKK